jgi:mannose-1-phosphate guanylyltransferase
VKGFIFAAGYGERLKPITDFMPKALVPVINLPSICYSVMLLREAGIKEIICNLHYRHGDIKEFFRKSNFGADISFSYEKEILGTGGGLKKCEKLLNDGPFVILNSDVIMDIDIKKICDLHIRKKSAATVVLKETPEAKRIGPVGVIDGRVADFKNFLGTGIMSDYIYTGAAVLSPEIFDYLETGFSSVVYTGYVDIIRKKKLDFFAHDGYWHDIGDLKSYRDAGMSLMNSIGLISPRVTASLGMRMEAIADGVLIGKGASIENSIIGSDCRIGEGAHVINSVLLPGSGVTDGRMVKNAVVLGEKEILSGPVN